MFNKESQFISVLRFDNQVKLDYKKLKNDNLEKSDESTFIIYDEILSKEIALKLNTWQKDITNTYISTLCLCDDEKIIRKTNKKVNDFSKAALNEKLEVALRSSKLFEVKHYFEFTGLDYVFSPFQVLNLHLEQNPQSNSLIVLTINNFVYLVIVDELNKIVYNKICKTSTFSDIKESKFYNSEVVGQKLYDEIYALELQNYISETLKDYYSKNNNHFIEKIDILYSIKQLSDEQIQQIEDDILISVHYHYISLKESLYELSRSANSKALSYVKPRTKKKSSSFKWLLVGLLSLGLISGVAFYYKDELNKLLESKKEIKNQSVEKKQTKKKEITLLPNHVAINKTIKDDVKSLLDVIPYDMTLDSLDLKRNNSTLAGKMITPDSYIKDIQPKLLNMYKYSNIQVKDSKNVALDVIIYNNEVITNQKRYANLTQPDYLKDGFMPIKRVTEQLKIILPNSAVINFDSSFKLKITTYNYRVNMIIQTPKEFYMLLDDLNKEMYSINIAYPIVFLKNENGIEVDFGLQFNQIP